jgi:NAD(P)-dependent dehydrogenase (short-subunit alcohol dehydrogenase family)
MSQLLESFRIKDGHALIIGASGGIGAAVAKTFAASGVRTTLAGRNLLKLENLMNSANFDKSSAACFHVDITDINSVNKLFADASKIQEIDIVVVCSGVSSRYEILEMPEAEFRRVIETNLTGTWNCAKASGERFIPRKKGKLILFGSLTSHFGLKYASAYAASKGAVAQITKSLAVEWAEHNIQVNAVAPGFVETEMTKVSLAIPERRKWILDRTPAKRTGTPEEIANAVYFLATPASNFVTGHILYVDGGFMAGSQW